MWKTLILNALLNPLAKKPPNGPINEANRANTTEWPRNGRKLRMGSLWRTRRMNASGRGASNSLNEFLKLFFFSKITEFGKREELCNSDCPDSMTQPGTQIGDFPSCSRRAEIMENLNFLCPKPTTNPKIIVLKAPPMNPSQVFFGDSLISGVLPQKKPNM